MKSDTDNNMPYGIIRHHIARIFDWTCLWSFATTRTTLYRYNYL